MYFPELFGIVPVIEDFGQKLFAGQIKQAVTDHVVAVIVPVRQRYAIDSAPEDVLDKEGSDGTLTESPVFFTPVCLHAGRAGLTAPEVTEDVIKIPGISDGGKSGINGFNVGSFPADKAVFSVHAFIIPQKACRYRKRKMYDMIRTLERGKT